MIFLYRLFILFYQSGIRLAALWNAKAAQWTGGRKHLFAELKQAFPAEQPIIWVHSSSAGEFEQAKPVIESLKKLYPAYKILVTFFSPSGYNVGKKNKLADYVFYLPADTAKNARSFLQLVQPRLVVFVKYDFWYFHLKEVHDQNIPLLLVSSIFRKNQVFFQWYGRFYKKMLHFFSHLFVQDQTSASLLQQQGIHHCTVSGDTRFDRVAAIQTDFKEVPFIKDFTANQKTLVAGSTWPDDEKALANATNGFEDIKIIIAPHEITEDHIKGIEGLFPGAVRYSKVINEETAGLANKRVLIIDNIGTLSRLYNYATITYIGGGFNKSGIHNTLEAAVYGKPVLFGPNYQKFREARELISEGGAFAYGSTAELQNLINTLLNNKAACASASKAAFNYVQCNKGATQTIMNYIQENRLLTN